tara:strand:+ start:168 stop:356 length:189 start_codon:yes stop_codon:yes gene_type:complete
MRKLVITFFIILLIYGCGKVGPLSLPEDQLDKSVITYPCNEACLDRLDNEKQRQQSVIVETE